MKKFFISIALCFVGIFSIFCLSGCGGLSAYEIAVRNGYKGTESQWLQSLKGDNGKDGENGVDYEDIKKLYEQLYNNGEYTGSFLEFVKEYVNVYDTDEDIIASRCLLSSVSVSAFYKVGMQSGGFSGSGVIYKIDEENDLVYIVTNYHCLYVYQNDAVADEIYVNLYGSESTFDRITCSYVGGSDCYDLAILKAEGVEAQKIIDSDAEAVELAKYHDITPGESVIAIGNPGGLGITVVSGVVSADNRYVDYDISSNVYYHRVFQTDAAINGGNSGGGVFNDDGYLIGIANLKLLSVNGNEMENMSYAIPAVHVASIAEYVIKYCNGSTKTFAKMYDFGMGVIGANSEAVYDTEEHKTKIVEDVAVESLKTNSLAQKVGLEAGDIIKKISITNSSKLILEEITREFMVNDTLMFLEEGDSLSVEILRGGLTQTLTYTISDLDSDFLVNLERLA